MFSGLFRIPFLLAAATFAAMDTVPSLSIALPPNVIVDPPMWVSPYPQSATVVVQDTAAWLVTEFAGGFGCVEQVELSMTPSNGGSIGTLRADWDYPLIKMDSASAAACSHIKRIRRIDRLPTMEFQTFGVPGPVRIPYSPDTVKFCRGGDCLDIAVRKVRTPSTGTSQCLEAVARPFDTHQQAVDFLKGRVAQSRAAVRLSRQRLVYFLYASSEVAPIENVGLDTVPSAIKCVDPLYIKGFVAPNGGWPEYLQPLVSWNDPRVGSAYASPSLANANDMYGKEELKFYLDTIALGDVGGVPYMIRPQTLWSYSTGVEGYLYRGSSTTYNNCGWASGTGATVFADTLATSGQNLLITNARPQCGRQDVDGFADTRDTWFALLPWTGEPLESVFRHYASVETSWSWPLEGDSILVMGQKVAIGELQATSGIANRHGLSSGLNVAVVGRSLSVELGVAAELRVLDAAGHVLTSRTLAQGRSLVSLPKGARGMLVVQANGINKTVVVP